MTDFSVDAYKLCLREAKQCSMRDGNADGAVAFVLFGNNGLRLFKNRNRRARDFLSLYKLSCCGFQEHAEQAVLNDVLRYASDNNDTIKSLLLFVGGYYSDKPYYYKYSEGYTCMNCASYIYYLCGDRLPSYATFVMLPAKDGWWTLEPFILYKQTAKSFLEHGKITDVRSKALGVRRSAH